MGLGKTLTMISLIMTTLAQKDSIDESDDSDDDEWSNDHKPLCMYNFILAEKNLYFLLFLK